MHGWPWNSDHMRPSWRGGQPGVDVVLGGSIDRGLHPAGRIRAPHHGQRFELWARPPCEVRAKSLFAQRPSGALQ